MKVETANRNIQRSASFEEKTMGLAKGSEAFVFNVLRKDLYSDPIGSLIREYTVNAQDEHRKHNKSDKGIFIKVPNHFSPELHIRDFAGGLTEEQVFEFFGNYGASDKRDSNLAVGFFGLGCKSAFAYTDSYIVKSFKDGMEYTFNIYIDETEVGKTAKISSEPTTEPNGVQIIVPVKTHDISTFQRKVVSTVKFFKTKPTIEGMDVEPDLEPKKAFIKGDGWEFFGRGSATVIMGEIPYPVDYYKMGDDLENWESNLLQSEINIRVDIGDVQVTASREALQMSPKTIATIREKLKAIKDTMVAETEKAFASVKNLIEAKALWNTVVGNGGGYSNIIRNHGIKWKGEKLEDNVIRFEKQLHYVTSYYNSRSGSTIKCDSLNYLICKEGETIYFDDTDQAQVGYKRRARTLLNNGDRRVTIIHTTDRKALEKLLGMSVTNLASYKAVTPTAAANNRLGGTGVDLSKRAKHASKMFVLDVDKVKGYFGAASEVWEIKDVTNPTGVYIPIERFKPTGVNRLYDLDSLRSVLVNLEKAGIKIDATIYGIKKGGDVTGLVKFDDWLDATLKANKKLIEDYSLAMSYSGSSSLIDTSNLNVSKLPEGSVAKEYATQYKKVRDLHLTANKKFKIFNYSRVTVSPDKTVATLSAKFTKQYPLLKFVSTWSYREPEVVSYITEREGDN